MGRIAGFLATRFGVVPKEGFLTSSLWAGVGGCLRRGVTLVLYGRGCTGLSGCVRVVGIWSAKPSFASHGLGPRVLLNQKLPIKACAAARPNLLGKSCWLIAHTQTGQVRNIVIS